MTTFDSSAAAPAPSVRLGRAGGAWLAVLGLLILWGLAAWIYQLTQGLIVTGMRDEVSWGLYIVTFAFFVGLSAGGLIMASAAAVFGVGSVRPLARLGALAAGACVLVAAMTIIPDLGNPQRVWELFRYPNWSSPMIWDILIVVIYFVLAAVDLAVMTRRGGSQSKRARTLRIVAYIGLPAAVLLHSITAWIFGVQISRPFWNTALLAPLFVTSAILSGTALIALVALAAQRFDRLQLPDETWSALKTLLAATIAIELFLVGADYLTILWGNVPRDRAALDMILPGGSWQWVFWLEWVVGGLIPFLLLVVPRWRRRTGLFAFASVLILVGVYAFRIELVVGGLLKPILSFAPGVSLGSSGSGGSSFQLTGSYHPTWVEYAIVTGLIAFLALLLTLGYRWLRSQPDEAAT
ncbi:MAG TPA: NrfD/PsrC family molybdoenzyme membrane anchor subunit [Solirubrobacteraceae bacterium]|nr:NrfD/PsrC family molybdoenzyme membrane anchor subunit [Solirubrobacteraceae bacterium]